MSNQVSQPRVPLRRRGFNLPRAILVAGFAMVFSSFAIASAEPVGTIIDYEQTANAILPPASSFAGSAGGDGWALGFNETNVYNIFHHDKLKFACHSKSTAAACAGNGYSSGTKAVSDGTSTFRVSMTPPIYIDQTTNHMFTMAVKVASGANTGTSGVVEVDLSSTNANPYVAFYPLSRSGEGACNQNLCSTQNSAVLTNTTKVGTKWYVYNYVSGVANPALPDSRNKLLCFDLATKSACAGQPYNVQTSGGVQARVWEIGNIASIDNKVFVNIFKSTNVNQLQEIACVDVSSTPANCSGWPINPVATVTVSSVTFAPAAPPFPLLNSSGSPIGVCFPGAPNVCTDFSGTTQTIPTALANLANVKNIPYATARSEAHFYGTRMYIPSVDTTNSSANVNIVSCYDFATDALCSGFPAPKSFTSSELSGIYTIQTDPSYPTCLWVNANSGTKQIQNFDYETGGACGAGGSVLPISNFLESTSFCEVKKWKKFTLVKPTVGNWTSGTVEFDDVNGDRLSGVSVQNIGSNGTLDVSSLNLETKTDFAKVRVRLVGATTPTIDVKMTWTAEWHPECTVSGQTALTSTTTIPGATTTTAAGATTSTIAGATTTTMGDPFGSLSEDNDPVDLTSSGANTRAITLAGVGVILVGAATGALNRRRRPR